MPIVADAAVAVRGDFSRFNRDLSGVEKKATTLGQKLKSAFSPANLVGAAGGLFAGAQVVGFLNDTAAAASDLEEAQSKVNVVFGEGVDDINAWAEGSASGFLMSKRAALEAAGTYGNLFQAFGIARPAATEMSKTLVELAADLASFNNTSVEDALLALRSGLSGETEPLKRYGVAINQVRLEEVALAKGIWDGVGALDSAQKAQAAYALILEDTALAQGDVARTSEGLANSQREMAAKIENAQAEIGKAWASIQLGAIRVIETLTDDPFEGFAMNFGEQGDRIRAAADVLGTDFETLRGRIERSMDESGLSFDEAMEAIEGEVANAKVAVIAETGAMMVGVGDAISAGIDTEVKPEFERLAAEGVSIMSGAAQDFRDAAFQNQVSYAKGLLDGQNQPKVQMEALAQMQEESMSKTTEVAYLMGQLTSKELAAGLSSDRDTVRAQAEATRMAIVNRLSTLGVSAFNWGYGIAHELALGMAVGRGEVIQGAAQLGGAVRSQIGIESEPSGADSPLRGITRWGGNIVKTIAEGIYGELGSASNAASVLAGALVPSFGAPAMAGAFAEGGGAGGPTYVINVNGVQRTASSPEEAMEALAELGAFSEGRL
jgi:hypothetical protein